MKILFKPQKNTSKNDGEEEKPEEIEVVEVAEKPKKPTRKKSASSEKQAEVKEEKEKKEEKSEKSEKAEKPAKEEFNEGVQMALFPVDEPKTTTDSDEDDEEEKFDKEKIKRYFKRHPKKPINTKVERFSPKLNKGLTQSQVETRFRQFLFNDTNSANTRSYTSIIVGNVCTFFNLLCLIAFIALLLANTQGFSNYLVIVITTINIAIGSLKIRAKRSIDKLALLASNTIKVVRDGETVEIDVKDVVLDDVLILELGNQVPADCILAEGSVEVNESLLTGESIAIKKTVGDMLYAGSFISSGNGKFRVEKVDRKSVV